MDLHVPAHKGRRVALLAARAVAVPAALLRPVRDVIHQGEGLAWERLRRRVRTAHLDRSRAPIVARGSWVESWVVRRELDGLTVQRRDLAGSWPPVLVGQVLLPLVRPAYKCQQPRCVAPAVAAGMLAQRLSRMVRRPMAWLHRRCAPGRRCQCQDHGRTRRCLICEEKKRDNKMYFSPKLQVSELRAPSRLVRVPRRTCRAAVPRGRAQSAQPQGSIKGAPHNVWFGCGQLDTGQSRLSDKRGRF